MFALLSIFLIILWSQRDFLFTEALVGNTNNVRFILENEYPPVACIAEYNSNPTLGMSFICTGVFISSTHVLTVEHCLYNIQSNKVQVLVGPGELSRSVTYSSIWWISFNQWASSNHLLPVISNNDISIIKILGLPVEFAPAVLSAITSNNVLYGLHAQTFGCGITNSQSYPTTIQSANVTVLRNSQCEEIVTKLEKIYMPIPYNIICTHSQPYVHLHHGDSGGPLLSSGTLIAINLGIIPTMGFQFHEEKVNIHLVILPYKNFLHSVINNPY